MESPFFALYHPCFRKQLGVDRGVLGVALDEVAARFHIIAHQHREDVVGFGSVLNRHVFQHARFGIHRGVPQLSGVHFTETFVALERNGVLSLRGIAVLRDEFVLFAVIVAIFLDFSLAATIKRRHGDV